MRAYDTVAASGSFFCTKRLMMLLPPALEAGGVLNFIFCCPDRLDAEGVAYSCSDKAVSRPKLISEQKREIIFAGASLRAEKPGRSRSREDGPRSSWLPSTGHWGCVLRSQSKSPAKKFLRPCKMWRALSLLCSRRSASSRTNDAELGRPRRGASCPGCSSAGAGYTLTKNISGKAGSRKANPLTECRSRSNLVVSIPHQPFGGCGPLSSLARALPSASTHVYRSSPRSSMVRTNGSGCST